MEHMDWSALDLVSSSGTEAGETTVADVAGGSFHAAVDKALLDALLTAPDRGIAAHQYLRNIHRLLQAGSGPFVIVSHGPPDTRLALFMEETDAQFALANKATAAAAEELAASSSPAQAARRLSSHGLIPLLKGVRPWASVHLQVLPKPGLTISASGGDGDDQEEDDGDDEDDSSSDSDQEREEVAEGGEGSGDEKGEAEAGVWDVLATAAHFAYVCYK